MNTFQAFVSSNDIHFLFHEIKLNSISMEEASFKFMNPISQILPYWEFLLPPHELTQIYIIIIYNELLSQTFDFIWISQKDANTAIQIKPCASNVNNRRTYWFHSRLKLPLIEAYWSCKSSLTGFRNTKFTMNSE